MMVTNFQANKTTTIKINSWILLSCKLSLLCQTHMHIFKHIYKWLFKEKLLDETCQGQIAASMGAAILDFVVIYQSKNKCSNEIQEGFGTNYEVFLL